MITVTVFLLFTSETYFCFDHIPFRLERSHKSISLSVKWTVIFLAQLGRGVLRAILSQKVPVVTIVRAILANWHISTDVFKWRVWLSLLEEIIAEKYQFSGIEMTSLGVAFSGPEFQPWCDDICLHFSPPSGLGKRAWESYTSRHHGGTIEGLP